MCFDPCRLHWALRVRTDVQEVRVCRVLRLLRCSRFDFVNKACGARSYVKYIDATLMPQIGDMISMYAIARDESSAHIRGTSAHKQMMSRKA